jgi:hypothetical protein
MLFYSETSEGLHNCLDKLHKYCEVWGLQVNIKKTKSMIFNNTGRFDPIKFTCNKNIVENVRKY